ncbi:MAG TPA: DNA (cytosine-5-)-methyltransferase [Candidatus Pacearchaeota archaeon]|nr:DNA (cytosine-5-)-methyltransferase [Candidatus Pacearchaeota archaeon]
MLEENINYLDLFSGIGGFRFGLKQAGFKFKWEGHSEIDKYAESLYHKYFPQSECLGDVRKIIPDGLPRIDIITFGFPCSDLSVAGKRKGLHGERSGLFFEAMRIIKAIRPKIFIFENVKGLLSSNGGRDFVGILREIASIGIYECEWELINSKWFVPQNRERIFFIGHFGGKSSPQVFPLKIGHETYSEDNRQKRQNRLETAYSMCIRGGAKQRYDSETLIQYGASQDMRLSPINGVSQALNAGHYNQPKIIQKTRIRRLTPMECEKLQGFPAKWTEKGIDKNGTEVKISDTQRYKMLGNAVTTNVVKEIGRRLME